MVLFIMETHAAAFKRLKTKSNLALEGRVSCFPDMTSQFPPPQCQTQGRSPTLLISLQSRGLPAGTVLLSQCSQTIFVCVKWPSHCLTHKLDYKSTLKSRHIQTSWQFHEPHPQVSEVWRTHTFAIRDVCCCHQIV